MTLSHSACCNNNTAGYSEQTNISISTKLVPPTALPRKSRTMESNEVKIEDAPPGYRSSVWQYFGFPVKKDNNGNRVTEKTKTVCKLCYAVIPYTTSNTTNMNHHLQRYHKNVKTALAKTSLPKGQLTMKQALTPTLPPSSPRAKQITRLIGEFIADYMAPFNIVANRKFIQMFKVLEPKFKMPCRGHFSEKVIPGIYNETKQSVKECLKHADRVALTTDSWTSRATQSYVTITAQVIIEKWESKSFVLQTRELSESHTGVNIAQVLRNSLSEWELTRPHTTIACVTDNASNMDIAVRESGLHPHIKCLAHVVNLASKRGLAVSRVARLLGRVRRITTFFHKSTTATAVLCHVLRVEVADHMWWWVPEADEQADGCKK
ncbi:E3 SUMO-protein ligase ZBED1-like isoform X1 [Nothobranchius furzeri]|uniref:E3 SUMO-protein ligase ZBED1-like isoform X1 n=1 Tax=Nothobranchius furzeri TaxID=105023 RepID=UPI003904A8DD